MLPTLAASNSGGGSSAFTLLFPLLLIALFFFVFIRPQRARRQQAQQLQSTLAVGAEVMTTAGLYGTVSEIGADTVTLEVSPGVHLRFARAAIARVVPPLSSETIELPPDDQPPS